MKIFEKFFGYFSNLPKETKRGILRSGSNNWKDRITKEDFKRIRSLAGYGQKEMADYLKEETGVGSRDLVAKIEAGTASINFNIFKAIDKLANSLKDPERAIKKIDSVLSDLKDIISSAKDGR